MNSNDDLTIYIKHGKEERFLEYKAAMNWRNPLTRISIAKAIMAMSNLKEGGVIVIGMRERQKNAWVPEGLDGEDMASFNQDDIATYVNDKVRPFAQFSLSRVNLDSMDFVILRVQEFDETPLIVTKQAVLNGKSVLTPGEIYYRSRRKNESAPVASEEDVRELVGLAIHKGVAAKMEYLATLGVLPRQVPSVDIDQQRFAQERGGL